MKFETRPIPVEAYQYTAQSEPSEITDKIKSYYDRINSIIGKNDYVVTGPTKILLHGKIPAIQYDRKLLYPIIIPVDSWIVFDESGLPTVVHESNFKKLYRFREQVQDSNDENITVKIQNGDAANANGRLYPDDVVCKVLQTSDSKILTYPPSFRMEENGRMTRIYSNTTSDKSTPCSRIISVFKRIIIKIKRFFRSFEKTETPRFSEYLGDNNISIRGTGTAVDGVIHNLTPISIDLVPSPRGKNNHTIRSDGQ